MDPLLDPDMAEWLRQKQAALGDAIAADKKGQEDADRRALLMQFAQSYANKRPMPVAPRQVNDERQRFGIETGLEDKARGYGMDVMRFGASLAERQAARDAAAASKAEERAARQAEREDDRGWRERQAALDRQARIDAARASAERRDAHYGAKNTLDLRKEFQGDPVVKATKEMGQAINKIRNVPEDGTGDLALIYSYVKILDPGSVVREGEIALSREPTPLLTELMQRYKKAAQGDLLHPDLRAAYKNSAEKLWEAQVGQYDKAAGEYRRLATDLGVDPSSVVLDLGFQAKPGAQAAAPEGAKRPRRTVNGETREWDGTRWVPVGG